MVSLDFTAVDFETANGFRGSPCSVGLVRIRGGVEVASLYTELRPPAGFDRFDPRNIAMHGITAESVASAPRFGAAFGTLSDFIGEDTLVAHNATFDLEVFQAALEVSAMDSPGMRFWCSVQLSREIYDLASHALPLASAEAGHTLGRHHHALDDARACAAIVADISRRRDISDLDELFTSCGLEAQELAAWTGAPEPVSRMTAQVRAMGPIFDSQVSSVEDAALPDLLRWQDEGRNLPPAPDADPDHVLFGQGLVFTGSLGVPRPEAKRLVAERGARTASRVTAGTTMLIVGGGFLTEGPGDQPQLRTTKAREALRRRSEGQPLQMIDEAQFRELLGGAWPVGAGPAPTSLVRLTPEP